MGSNAATTPAKFRNDLKTLHFTELGQYRPDHSPLPGHAMLPAECYP